MDPGPSNVPEAISNAGPSVLLTTLDASSSTRRVSSERAKLSKEGYAMLREFAAAHDLRPTIAQRKEFLTRLHALVGCDYYTFKTLSNYMSGRRSAIESRQHEGTSTSHDILYPSLNSDTIEKLEVLFKETQFPATEVIKIWAARLKVTYTDVKTWIDLKCAGIRKEGNGSLPAQEHVSGLGASHLPTPELSTSPEPSTLSKHLFDPDGTPEPSTTIQDNLLSLSLEQLEALGEELALASKEFTHLDEVKPPPISAEEFSARFAPHEEKMLLFLKRVNSGAYTPWGFYPLDKPMDVDIQNGVQDPLEEF